MRIAAHGLRSFVEIERSGLALNRIAMRPMRCNVLENAGHLLEHDAYNALFAHIRHLITENPHAT